MINKFLTFIENSPTAFQAVENIKIELEEKGFTRLYESRDWNLEKGGKYYVTRNDSAICAFVVPEKDFTGFQIIASHSDSPALKIKENPEMEVEGHYVKLNVEKYGGMLCSTWFDKPLSVAGRVVVKSENSIEVKFVDLKENLLMIPSLAIHMNREANEGYKYNAQKDLLPVIGDINAKGALLERVANAAGVNKGDIISQDLFVYNRQESTVWGANKEYISAPRLDDLECAYTSLQGFLQADNISNAPVYMLYDNEEVGSGTRQGAASTFMKDVLFRICKLLGYAEDEYIKKIAGSFMLSADNAHAIHPNYTDKYCPTNKCYMNEGIVVKFSANQKYTTDAVTAALFRKICEKAEVKTQTFFNRSDMAGGSTLGNISGNQVPVKTVDIGLAQLAMHSSYETAGVKDVEYMIKASKCFYESVVMENETGYELK